MTSPSYEQYNLLLLGRTGNGKSSTGNSILGERAFIPGNGNSDDVIEFNSALVDGLHIQVVDGTGTGDTGSDAKRDVQSLLTHIRETLWRFVLNVHVIIVVLKYGQRFTKQEKDALELIKSVFGKNVLKKWGVIVMTHGDNFEMDNEDENGTFEDWLKEQVGEIQTLIAECDNRCVLFNNREKDENKKRVQRHNLMEKVKAIKHEPYTEKVFQEAIEGHIKILVQSSIPKLQSRVNEIIEKIKGQVAIIQNRMTSHPGDCIEKLQKMSRELESQKLYLNQEDRGTGLVKPMLLQISLAEMSLESSRKRCQQLVGEESHSTVHPVPAPERTVPFRPAEEFHATSRPARRSPWRFSWSSKECLATAGGVVIVVSTVTLVFASRYASF